MNTELEHSLEIESIINYPREVQAGQNYLITINLRHKLNDKEWPYAKEEYAITCRLDTRPLFTSQPLEEPVIILHRFDNSLPTRFLLTAGTEEAEGSIMVILSNECGVPLQVIKLPNIKITK